MKTEFLVPFQFDTTAVEQRLESEAYNRIVEDIENKVMAEIKQSLPRRYGKPDWQSVAEHWFWNWLDNHDEEIIDMAIILLAKKAKDKRRWKDVLRELKEESS